MIMKDSVIITYTKDGQTFLLTGQISLRYCVEDFLKVRLSILGIFLQNMS